MKYFFQFFFIFWVSGWNFIIPQNIINYIDLFFISVGVFFFLRKMLVWKMEKIDFAVILLALVFPLYASFMAYFTFGQPVLIGLLSLRGYFLIFFAYFLCRVNPYKFINRINEYNILLCLLCFGLLYFTEIDNNVLSMLRPERTDVILTGLTEGDNTLRGQRITYGSSWILFSFIYYASFIKKNNIKRYAFHILLLVVYVLFVHKGRILLVSCFLVLILPYFKSVTFVKILKSLLIFIVLLFIVLNVSWIYDRFIIVSDLFGSDIGGENKDFSGIARYSAILYAIPLILQSPIFGVGNLSYHFNNGFIGYFGDHFYISDIGLFGTLLIGGFFLLIIYVYFYKNMLLYSRKCICYCGFLYVLFSFYFIQNFIGSDVVFNKPLFVSFILSLVLYKPIGNGS